MLKGLCLGLLLLVAFEAGADCVVLLHGLARTDASMEKMEAALREDGFDVVNVSYPSREKPIA